MDENKPSYVALSNHFVVMEHDESGVCVIDLDPHKMVMKVDDSKDAPSGTL